MLLTMIQFLGDLAMLLTKDDLKDYKLLCSIEKVVGSSIMYSITNSIRLPVWNLILDSSWDSIWGPTQATILRSINASISRRLEGVTN